MQSFVERIDLSSEHEFVISWRIGASVPGYAELRQAMAVDLQGNANAFANQALARQRHVVERLANECGITEWQP